MAFTVTARHTASNGTTDSQTATTNSTTPTANSLLVVASGSQAADASPHIPVFGSISGGSLSYTQRAHAVPGTSTQYAASLYVGTAPVGGSPSAFAITVDNDNGTRTLWYGVVCCDVTGHDSTSPIVQSKAVYSSEAGGNSESTSATFDSTPTEGNLILCLVTSAADSGGGISTPTGFTEVADNSAAYQQSSISYKVAGASESATVTVSDLGQSVYQSCIVLLEIKAGTSGTTVNPTAGSATGTGYAAVPNRSGAAGAGAATGTGYSGAVKESVAAGVGQATGTGYAAVGNLKVAPTAGAATGTGYNATVSSSGGNVTANPTAGAATGTGYGAAPTIATAPSAGAGTGTGYGSTLAETVAAGLGAAAGTGYGSTVAESVAAGLGAATGTGYNASPSYGGGNVTANPTAGSASGAGYDATLRASISQTAGSGTGAGYGPVPGATLYAPAGAATGTGYGVAIQLLVPVGLGSALGTGYDAITGGVAATVEPFTLTVNTLNAMVSLTDGATVTAREYASITAGEI